MMNHPRFAWLLFAAIAAFVASRAFVLLAMTPVYSNAPAYFQHAAMESG